MNNIYGLIDYTFIKSFNIKMLRENLFLPISNDGFYLNCYTCEESKTKSFANGSILNSKYLAKEQILFFLNDIDFRIKIFHLSKKILSSVNDSPIEEFLHLLLKKAIEKRSSDIHIESLEKLLIIRFRIDGSLKLFYIFEKALLKALSSYIKMLSKLDITQNRMPMDGSFTLKFEDTRHDFRVSTMPTVMGESIVIRVLDNKHESKDIKNLGFSKNILKNINDVLKLSQGLVLITGPTGSGKSTTLYSIIKKLNLENKKIITVENPVEYKLDKVQQIEVNEELGLAFDMVLKNILRQDPDVILIGEIRDESSLKIALQASLTGHLVLASIHAKSSIETLTRLLDLNANRYLLSSSLKYIFSQRLVLKTCEECKGKTCKACDYSGFYGRASLCEVLEIDDELSSLILQNKSLKEYLQNKGFKSMMNDALEKVDAGETTLEEVYRVLD